MTGLTSYECLRCGWHFDSVVDRPCEKCGHTMVRPIPHLRIVGPDWKPPVGGMGGAIHDWERGLDPWHGDAFPWEFKDSIPNTGERKGGWFALDYWKNEIGFLADGTTYPTELPPKEGTHAK